MSVQIRPESTKPGSVALVAERLNYLVPQQAKLTYSLPVKKQKLLCELVRGMSAILIGRQSVRLRPDPPTGTIAQLARAPVLQTGG